MRFHGRFRIIPTVLLIAFLAVSAHSFGPQSTAAVKIYDFTDSVNNKAFKGTDSNQPPIAGPEIGAPFSAPGEYDQIARLDGVRAQFEGTASDYHRFRFKILEPMGGQIYAEHHGYGSNLGGQPFGLKLYIWNFATSKWEFLDQHDQGSSDAITKGTRALSGTYVDANGFLHLLAQAKENTGSCPFLYAFDGEKFVFVADLFGDGIIGRRKTPVPEDYAKIDGMSLRPSDGVYRLRIAQEFDEISYLDQIALMTVDHSPDVDVFPSLLSNELGKIYTVSTNPASPLSAVDVNGGDVLSEIISRDGVCTTESNPSMIQLNLGDLSGAKSIKLVIVANTRTVPNATRVAGARGGYVEVKDGNGDWITIFDKKTIGEVAEFPRTYVLDLTGKFVSNDYSVRIGSSDDVRFDYIGVDSSTQKEVRMNVLAPISSNLHSRGYSKLKGMIAMPDYYDLDRNPPQSFSKPSGNFTRFGEVLPLLVSRDDKFVIMHHGDEISVDFNYLPKLRELERDFLFYAWGYYKNKFVTTGDTVEPLPFHGMSSYPYPTGESYPYDMDHATYLREYNTRTYSKLAADTELGHHTIYTNYVKVEVIPAAVGGVAKPMNTFAVLAPYLTIVGLVAAASAVYVMKRRRAA